MEYIEFDCGCKFQKIGEKSDGSPIYQIDYENLNYNCGKVWELFRTGNTKGVFQLETNLGIHWSKQLAPDSITEIAALISIIRPGTLKSLLDGKSLTQHYCDRKNGREEITYFHPALEKILKPTNGTYLYQEQALQIVSELAGFSESEADLMRKSIGKKNAELLRSLESKFVEGCEKVGKVSKDEASSIFEMIRKSERYSFNKSHAIGYAYLCYWSALAKSHFPIEFFCAALKNTKDSDETSSLIKDAYANKIEVYPPDFRLLFSNTTSFIINQDKIYFGLSDIKGVGSIQIDKVKEKLKEISINTIGWTEFLVKYSDFLNKTSMIALISVGGFSYMKESRTKMLFEYEIWNQLTIKEKEKCGTLLPETTLQNLYCRLLQKGVSKVRQNKVDGLYKLLEAPPYSMEDTIDFIRESEIKYLGCPVTFNKVDSRNTDLANITCREYKDGKRLDKMIFGVEIKKVYETTTKKGKTPGQKMAFLTIDDGVELESVAVFPQIYEEVKDKLYEGNTVLLCCGQSKTSDLLIINTISEI